jgi:hypothetical protein
MNAGTYAVVASLDNANYEAQNATGNLVIAKAAATITLSGPRPDVRRHGSDGDRCDEPGDLTGVTITYDGERGRPVSGQLRGGRDANQRQLRRAERHGHARRGQG